MTKIARVHAREVLDSRGDPTVEVELWTDDGACGTAIVPAGASTGAAEACELRDPDDARYDGRGVRRAAQHVGQVLGPALRGLDPAEQLAIDERLIALDGTPNKSRLGANAILGVSLAAAHAAAAARRLPLFQHLSGLWAQWLRNAPAPPAAAAGGAALGLPAALGAADPAGPPALPLPMVNMISGGKHAGGNLDFQDVLIQPVGARGMAEALEWLVRVYRRLGRLLTEAGYEGRLVGDEGGYGPRLPSNRAAIEFVVRAIEAARLTPGTDVTLALDVASSHFHAEGTYRLAATGAGRFTSAQFVDELAALVDAFPITSIEDGLAEEDWDGWRMLTARLGGRVRLVGDDLFATHPDRVARGIASGVGNAVLVKMNQIGTLTETLRTMALAARAGYVRVVSARSGETEDTTMADLAVGVRAEVIKIGSIVRGERLAKYNRLLRIEEALGGAAALWRQGPRAKP